MKLYNPILLVFFIAVSSLTSMAQEDKRDAYLKTQTDSILGEPIMLEELVIDKNAAKAEEEAKKRFLILQRRVYKVYPYAKTAAERLTQLNRGMAALRTEKEKKKYFKMVEHYLTNEFEDQLKNLSRKDGQILVKLIDRQTGSSTYALIKSLKSGWKAYWSNNMASLFDIDLKTRYSPMTVNEDYLIETILKRAFDSRRLVPQKPAIPIDYDAVTEYWTERLARNKDN